MTLEQRLRDIEERLTEWVNNKKTERGEAWPEQTVQFKDIFLLLSALEIARDALEWYSQQDVHGVYTAANAKQALTEIAELAKEER